MTDQRPWREQPMGAVSRTTHMLLIAIALGLLISISNLVTMLILLIQQRNGEFDKKAWIDEVKSNKRKEYTYSGGSMLPSGWLVISVATQIIRPQTEDQKYQ